MSKRDGVFKTDRRIRLGVWGLGRGMSFYRACAALNLDVVAGCDFNEHMRVRFQQARPDALITDNADEFLAGDFDAVLLATYCPDHAADAIRCLEAGKHVLSEVTSFHTMAEGVRLVEAVEKSGLVYNLAENYPFTAAQMYIARRWKEGLFGELMYAEGEYVHEVRSLCYTYIDGVPIQPGWALHHWRSWLNFHYYCTHSLGPVMHITGARPARVVTLPGRVTLPGYPRGKVLGLGDMAPSLIVMSNGGLVKNLMGGTTNDSHIFRYWGTRGSAEINNGLFLRLGGSGSSPKLPVTADWGELTPLAEKMGHGGGDFWVLYYFARQILFGDPAPFDIYTAADCTIPGILAYRSSTENGTPFDIPDFRKKADRDRYRNDHFAQPRTDPERACFPRNADKRLIGRFNGIMSDLLRYAAACRAVADWSVVFEETVDKVQVVNMADRLIADYPAVCQTMRAAHEIIEAYPKSEGARLLREMLEVADDGRVLRRGYLDDLKKLRNRLRRRLCSHSS